MFEAHPNQWIPIGSFYFQVNGSLRTLQNNKFSLLTMGYIVFIDKIIFQTYITKSLFKPIIYSIVNQSIREDIFFHLSTFLYQPMAQRKTWTQVEDEFIAEKVSQNEILTEKQRLKWGEIADLLNHQFPDSKRTGKQCRQRWHNQLDPTIMHNQWSREEQSQLFQLQKQLGNKWAQIANRLKGRTDNNVKNYFYSTLRKSLRKLNGFILSNRSEIKSAKQFKQSALSKLLAVADHKFDKKINIKTDTAEQQAIQIKNMLIQIIHLQPTDRKNRQTFINLTQHFQQFNKSCKKKKCKRKQDPQQQRHYDQSLMQIQDDDPNDGEQLMIDEQQEKIQRNRRTKSRNGKKQKPQARPAKLSMAKKQSSTDKKQSLKGKKTINHPPSLWSNSNKKSLPQQVSTLDNSKNFADLSRSSLDLGKKPAPIEPSQLFKMFHPSDSVDQEKPISSIHRRRNSFLLSKKESSSFLDTIKEVNLRKNQSRLSQMSQINFKQQEFYPKRLSLLRQQSDYKDFPPFCNKVSNLGNSSNLGTNFMDSSIKFEPQLYKLRSFTKKESNFCGLGEYQFGG